MAGNGNFSLYHRNETGSEAKTASYQMDVRGSFPGVKRPGREADNSTPSNDCVKDAWSYISIPQYAFIKWCSVKAQRKLYFYVH